VWRRHPAGAFFKEKSNMLKLICALPEPGVCGVPRGLFYYAGTDEGERAAEEFARKEDRPGWGVFDLHNPVREASLETFAEILRLNGFPWK
jgi:hypothetical protein